MKTTMKRNDETTIIHTDQLATYLPDASVGHTQAVAVAVLDGPTQPEWDGIGDNPNTSHTPEWDAAKQAARNVAQDREVKRLALIIALIAVTIANVAFTTLYVNANSNQSFRDRYTAAYTGWVGTDSPIAMTILPCQHANACTDVQADVTIQENPTAGLDPHVYHLGGRLISAYELFVSGTYGGVTYSADIVSDHPILGNITQGKAQLTFKRGGSGAVYPMRSATSTEQLNATKGK